ncbi:ATP-binding protein [Candidatus Woesearchaeota archaeon]|nr:ATP-binding protein [Candidatus Woesearchaeota archaeon]
MLIEFNLTNYLSIREQTTLSLVKAKSQELESTNTFSPGTSATPALLRSSALYGANAAGKSNFVKALKFMKKFVMRSARESQAGEKLAVTTFLLDETGRKKPSEFEVTFVSQGVRYQYGFAVTQERIIEEWLLAYPKGRPQRWIERAYDEKSQAYVWGKMDKLSGQKQLWQTATRSNALFLSTAIQLNNQQLTPVFEWFSSTLHVVGLGIWSPSFSIELCENSETKNTIIGFLKAADVDIDDIQLKKEKFNKENLPNDMPDEIKKQIEKEIGDDSFINVKTAHSLSSGKKVFFDMENESDGTQKIFALAGPWIDTLKNGYVLVIDELHDNLHPLMVKFLVNLFHCRETNPKNAQLIFTTHDTSILNQEVFRRDQIWFCEKDKDQASKLYPLTDFSPRKGVENLERGYLLGRYGALPYLKNVKMAMRC